MSAVIKIIKGVVVGLGIVIPGLSASTFLVVMGIYDGMINSFNNLRKEFKKSVKFLLPIALGVILGILVSANLVLFLIEEFTLPSYAFFIGLVLGSVPVIYRKMKPGVRIGKNYVFFLLGLAAILLMTFLASDTNDFEAITAIDTAWHFGLIFLAGVVSCILMAVPGVSGSIVLMLMGMFDTVYGAVANFNDMILMLVRGEGGIMALGISSGIILAVYLGGALLGLFLAARIMGHLIKNHEAAVYFMVMGLVLGAVVTLVHLGVIGAFINAENALANVINTGMLVGFGFVGFILTRIIGKERADSGN